MKRFYSFIIFLSITLLSIKTSLYSQLGVSTHLVSGSTVTAQSDKDIIIGVAKNNIIIQTQQQEEIILYNTLGKEVFRGYSKLGESIIKVNTPGIYLIKVGNTVKKIAIKDLSNN